MKRLLKLTLQRKNWACALLTLAALVGPVTHAWAQGVTTGAINGLVVDAQKQPIEGAGVMAIHEPSGTRYEAVTLQDGRFSMLGMRVGGPYTVTVFHQGTGLAFEPQVHDRLVSEIIALGYRQVTIDPRGYRQGSLNEGLRLRPV